MKEKVPPPVGHDVRQSVERQRVVAENAVEDANGNCDAAAVEDAKNTPCVQMEVVVAVVVVAKVALRERISEECAGVCDGPLLVGSAVCGGDARSVGERRRASPRPLRNARTWPCVPAKSEVVEMAVGAALARSLGEHGVGVLIGELCEREGARDCCERGCGRCVHLSVRVDAQTGIRESRDVEICRRRVRRGSIQWRRAKRRYCARSRSSGCRAECERDGVGGVLQRIGERECGLLVVEGRPVCGRETS